MNRREAIQGASLLAGFGASAATILGVLEACARKAGPDFTPAVLSTEELSLVSRVADILLPRTDTPGALDVGVPVFIDTILKDTYLLPARQHYLEGLREFDAAARQAHREGFVDLAPAQQRALVERFQESAIAEVHARREREYAELARRVRGAAPLIQDTRIDDDREKPSFVLTTKALTLLGFFTSRPGATEVLQYVAIPGAYHGCLPLKQAGNGRTWAT